LPTTETFKRRPITSAIWQRITAVAQDKLHTAFGIAQDQFRAGALSNLDLLTTEQSLVAIDAAVASSDAAPVQDQIAVFKALGGGRRSESQPVRLSE
jgi:outer membrane protein TolC